MQILTHPFAWSKKGYDNRDNYAVLIQEKYNEMIDSINNDEDMPDSAKLKAIQKLMKGNSLKHPGKTYVVGKKGVFAKRGRNVKLVDRRMKVSVGRGGNG